MADASKRELSERDICTKFITPALTAGGKWDLMNQIREEVSFTKGRVIVRGQLSTRGEPKRADYILSYKLGIQLAIVEAKDNSHTVGHGMQQALEYAETLDALEEIVGRDYDPFDLICHVAYDQPPLTRKERAQQVRKRNYFGRFGDKARAVMEALLDKYADQGIEAIESPDALKIIPFPTLGTTVEIIQSFGGRPQFQSAMRDLKAQLYATA